MLPHGPKHGRRYYLSDIPLDQALKTFFSALERVGALAPLPTESISLEEARGRITGGPVWARVSSPHYDSAAMDGVAVRASETVGASETSPIHLRLGEQAAWIDTGDPIPPGFDAVVMLEVVHEVDGSTIEVQSPVAPYQHVRPLGEDIVATELVLPENHRLRPVDLAACAAAGLTEIPVRRRPTVVVIPTGTELVATGGPLRPGDIIESNSLMLAGAIEEWGGQAYRWPAVADDYDQLKATLLEAVRGHDIVVVNAGSSAGSEDYTARLVEDLGQLLVHGVAFEAGTPGCAWNRGQEACSGHPGLSSFGGAHERALREAARRGARWAHTLRCATGFSPRSPVRSPHLSARTNTCG